MYITVITYIYTHNIHIVRQPGIGDIYPNSGLSYQSKQTGPPWSDASCGGRLFASPPRSTLRWDWSIHEIWLVGQEHLQNPVGYLWISLVKKNMVSPYVNLFIPMNMNESPWWNAKFFTLPSLSRISDGNGCTEQFSERIDHWYSSLEWRDLWRDQAMVLVARPSDAQLEKINVVLWKRLGSWIRVWDIWSRYLMFFRFYSFFRFLGIRSSHI